VNSNYESENYALKAIEMIWYNLQNAVQKNEPRAKDQIQEASFLAGKAINITKTTAPHALSYAFTSYYNIPHGHAVALSLPYFLEFNYRVTERDCTDLRGAHNVIERIDNMLAELDLSIGAAPTAFVKFFNSLGININIPTLINGFDPIIIIENVNLERLNNNPRKVSEEVISNFLAI
jgi:alcohol dehydrogenase class IV